ncbi:MAG: hypothetical protein IKY82_08250 [Alistipes sp.]|nr:hypothetical protein [Alistipes sp.]
MKIFYWAVIVSTLIYLPARSQNLITQSEYYDSLKTTIKSVYTTLPTGEKHGTEKVYTEDRKHTRTNTYENGKMISVKTFLPNGLTKVEAEITPESNDTLVFYSSYTSYGTSSRNRRFVEIVSKLHNAQNYDNIADHKYNINYGKQVFDIKNYRIETYKQHYLSGKPRIEFTTSEDKKFEYFVTYDEEGEINRYFTYDIENKILQINKFDGYNWSLVDSVFTIKGQPFNHEDVIEDKDAVYKKVYNYPIDTNITVHSIPMDRSEFYALLTTINKDLDTNEYYLSIKETGLDNIRYNIINASGDTSGISNIFVGRRLVWEWQANSQLKWSINTLLLPDEKSTPTDGTYHGDKESEWDIEAKYKNGVLSYLKVKQHGDIAQGEISENMFNGEGSSKIWSELYVGEFKDNLRHGKGKLDDDLGMYIGEFKDGLRDGSGKLYSKNALTFFAEYVTAMQNKQLFEVSSYTFDGQFKDDKPFNGVESANLVSGDIVEMHIKEGNLQGKGKYVWKSGESFEGNDLVKYNGNGKFTLSNGDYYNGEFNASDNENFTQPSFAMFTQGTVRITLPSGIVYIGEYNNGIEGQGKLVLSNGDELKGKFVNNQLDYKSPMQIKIRLDDGSIYEGAYVDEKVTGQGKLTTSNGETFEGLFKSGKLTTNPKIKVAIKKLEIPVVKLPY